MKFFAPLILFSSIVLILTSCHKFVPQGTGKFRWIENNKEYTSIEPWVNKEHGDSDISVLGCTEDHCLNIYMQSVFTPGSYKIGFNNSSIVNMSYSYGNIVQVINSGIVTISELSKQKISGTFTAKATNLNDSVIISGYFDMKFR
jgi:hypothetical protein